MAKRKTFKKDAVGVARFDLRAAQVRFSKGAGTRAEVSSAEKALNVAINVRKKRKRAKKL